MYIFEFKLKRKGEITLLPDSQKLFGFLMGKLKESYSDEKIGEFVESVERKESICMISNLFPTDYRPMPKSYILDILDKLNIGINDKKLYEKIKNIEFIKREDLKKLINLTKNTTTNINNINLDNYNYIKKEDTFIQKFKIESQVRELSGFPNIAYSIPIVKYQDNFGNIISDYSFLIKLEKGNILFDYLNNRDNLLNIDCHLGHKASYGYNTYVIKDIEFSKQKKDKKQKDILKYPKNEKFLNLGMLLPNLDKVNIEKSYFELFTSHRKPFELSDGVNTFISFLNAGSVLSLKEKSEYTCMSKCILNEYNLMYDKAIVFGNSYLETLEV
ncbi:CRISPR-associated protein Csm4 [Parvimonas sp. D2]|uniref:CRISPR-associated protein Csm4 n=1 Tax=unclassified Parvimonas TaxID=1151464 RepID=UPI002B498660|nr:MULTISPECIES: CRISPR-associated protein Csm4 [unclassified Parvimonas]MEB3012426.1 CRISPR-associated protein Csm4 [Parvimonas sp. D2]MEB3087920.1 CRISPR-associated protein Csm4 [Parvimonas sp. D4]